ncbi:MAG: carbohydrate binding family 9 domain-containing protein, partial [Candidatus Neomarinimicrobiota bacterium]
MNLKKITPAIFAFLAPLSANSGMETISSVDNKRVAAVELNGLAIINDGILDEDVWESGEWFGGFHQRNPDEGKPATFKTEFKIIYDDKYLYIGARAYDPEPEKIIAILSRRDEYTESDWLYVSLDSYNDNRTAFEFGINAAGVLHDIRRYDDNRMDSDWDANWEGSAHIGENGWTAEWRIPFSELRFTTSAEMEWGIQVYREMPRFDNELSVWNWWSNSEQGFVSRYGALNGLKN